MSPQDFDDFVMPHLKRLTAAQRELGSYVVKHANGNIMSIIDRLVECNPHALHSLAPQGDVDIADVGRRYSERICLMGNVNCRPMDTDTDEEVIAPTRHALRHGMPGGDCVFSTSNCICAGMQLRRYELILNVWRKEGNYAQ